MLCLHSSLDAAYHVLVFNLASMPKNDCTLMNAKIIQFYVHLNQWNERLRKV